MINTLFTTSLIGMVALSGVALSGCFENDAEVVRKDANGNMQTYELEKEGEFEKGAEMAAHNMVKGTKDAVEHTGAAVDAGANNVAHEAKGAGHATAEMGQETKDGVKDTAHDMSHNTKEDHRR